jgi:hypothetical protein
MVAVADVSGLKLPSHDIGSKRFSPDYRPTESSKNPSDLIALHRPLEYRVKKLLEKADPRSERFQNASQKLHETVSALAGVELKNTDQVLNYLVGLKDKQVIKQVAEAMKIFYNTTGISKNISIAKIIEGINKLNDSIVFNKAKKVADFAARQILSNDSVIKPEPASFANNSLSARKNEASPVLAA